METNKMMKRTHYCGDVESDLTSTTVTVSGWVQRRRDLGSLIFIDLRDRTGLVQLVFDEADAGELIENAHKLRNEFVLTATGTVVKRQSANKDLKTGDIEIAVEKMHILGESKTPPFEIVRDSQTAELTRLQYRYLDLRRPDLQENIIMRHKITKITRDYFDEHGFLEIETPMLIKSTPEGARDFLVPSRVHQGKFYALPQSPQIYKQLTMVAGFDRYMQIARCFRDEDLRADRQPEFTQVDLEMSFVDMEDIFKMIEGYMVRLFGDALNEKVKAPFKRLTYNDAMSRYGSDKPDTRFDMELVDLSDLVADCGFGIFESAIKAGGTVRAITAKNAVTTLTRRELDKLTEYIQGIGGKGVAWVRMNEDGSMTSSFARFISEEKMQEILTATGAVAGDVVLVVGDTKKQLALSLLGALRLEVAQRLAIEKTGFDFLWITEYPFFELDDELGDFVAMHHPFTTPTDESLEYLTGDKTKVYAKAYDLVLNGVELGSGSIRVTDPKLQATIFEMLDFTAQEAEEKFGFLVNAFEYGAPPHGGIGLGLDRIIMQMLGAKTLRDVLAFPKVQNASEAMTACPASVDKEQLDELGIALTGKPEKE